MNARLEHSPLGASGADRWMNCPGSTALLKKLDLPPSDEPEYRSLGTSAHSVAHKCLVEKLDAWEVAGQQFEKHAADNEMCNAVQVYLDEVRSLITPEAKIYFEFGIDAPEFHKDFYGTLDAGIVIGNKMYVRDYKHGEGLAVDTENNKQMMYYAYGLLRHHPEVEVVNMLIVQPRIAWRATEPWEISADALRLWAEGELLPAMLTAEMDEGLNPGPWCRFCPAKLICQAMRGMFGAAMTADAKQIVQLTDEQLGRDYQYIQGVKQFIKALEEEVFRRLNDGGEVPGTKLVLKRANRVWKAGAEKVFMELYPEEAMTKPELKSPAEMEKISPTAKKLVHEYAFTPQAGLTVALASDPKPGVKVQRASEVFAGAAANLGGDQ